MKIKILDSSHSLCSDSSMCIDNKYHESLANSSFFVTKLGQVWRPVMSGNYFAKNGENRADLTLFPQVMSWSQDLFLVIYQKGIV